MLCLRVRESFACERAHESDWEPSVRERARGRARESACERARESDDWESVRGRARGRESDWESDWEIVWESALECM